MFKQIQKAIIAVTDALTKKSHIKLSDVGNQILLNCNNHGVMGVNMALLAYTPDCL